MLTQDEAEARMEEKLAECWTPYTLILEEEATFEMVFELDESATPLWPTFEFKPLSSSSSKGMDTAIETARRAILRCGDKFSFNPTPAFVRASFSFDGVEVQELRLSQ